MALTRSFFLLSDKKNVWKNSKSSFDFVTQFEEALTKLKGLRIEAGLVKLYHHRHLFWFRFCICTYNNLVGHVLLYMLLHLLLYVLQVNSSRMIDWYFIVTWIKFESNSILKNNLKCKDCWTSYLYI